MRPPLLRLEVDEIVVDNFAGGGGASTGLEWATKRSPDIAINHDPEAIAMHRANHPSTEHYCESVWDVDPLKACGGRRVGIAWFSPDCTFHSKARGGKPFRDRKKANKRRGLAGVVVRWARLERPIKPRIICLENVEEFKDWGPLLKNGMPCKKPVIERSIGLWSNPGDVVFSPFAGICSEGHGALKLNRRFVGVELKESYFKQGIGYLERAERGDLQTDLFSTVRKESVG